MTQCKATPSGVRCKRKATISGYCAKCFDAYSVELILQECGGDLS